VASARPNAPIGPTSSDERGHVKVCRACSATLDGAALFCGSCGTKVSGLTTSSFTTQVPTTAHTPTAPRHPTLPQAGPAHPQPRPAETLEPAGESWGQRFALESGETTDAALIGLKALAGCLGAALVVILLGVLVFDGSNGSVLDWIQGTVMIVALAFGGSIRFSGEVDPANFGSASGAVTFSYGPLAITAVGLVMIWILSRRAEHDHTTTTWPRLLSTAVVTAAGFVGPLVLVALVFRGRLPFRLGPHLAALVLGSDTLDSLDGDQIDLAKAIRQSGSLSLTVGLIQTIAVALALITLAAALSRVAVSARSMEPPLPMSDRIEPWLAALRPFAEFVVLLCALTLMAGIIGYAVLVAGDDSTAAPNDDLGAARTIFTILLVTLTWLPNAVLAGAGLGLGGDVRTAASAQGTALGEKAGSIESKSSWQVGLFDGGVPAWVWLAMVVALLVAVLICVRLTVAHSRADIEMRSWWRFAIVFGTLWTLLTLLARGRATYHVSGSGSLPLFDDIGIHANGSAVAGLSVISMLVVGLIWGALIAVMADRVTTFVATTAPRTTFFAGSLFLGHVEAEWAARLALTTMHYGHRVPLAMAAAADGVTQVSDPLDARPSAARWRWIGLAGVLAVCCGLGLTAFVVNRTVFGPEAAANAYLDAVAQADATEAKRYLATPLPEGDVSMLTDGYLQTQRAAGRITGIHVNHHRTTDGTTTVPVRFSVLGQSQSARLKLVKQHKRRWGVFSTWRITNGVATAHLDFNASPIPLTINGYRIPGNPEEQTLDNFTDRVFKRFVLFPGTVAVKTPEPVPYFSSPDTTVAAAPDGDVDLTELATVQVTDVGIELIKQQVLDELQACTGIIYDTQANCPQDFTSVSYEAYDSDVNWLLEDSDPTIVVAARDGDPATFDITASLMFTAAYQDFLGEPHSDPEPTELNAVGHLSPTGDITISY
jgi:hypothetical protein